LLKFIYLFVLVPLAIAAGAVLLLYIFQRRLLYPAPRVELPLQLPAHVQKIDFEYGYGLYLPAIGGQSPAPALIFAHGNGEVAKQWIDDFDTLANAGFAVMLVEYPSYAGAAGKPSYDTMRHMAVAAYDFLSQQPEVDSSSIVAYGRSLGGGAACLLAEARPVAALVLESTFSTLKQLVGEMKYPSAFLKDRYDNVGIVAATNIPVFIYHGTEDELIGVHHADALHNAARNSELLLHKCDTMQQEIRNCYCINVITIIVHGPGRHYLPFSEPRVLVIFNCLKKPVIEIQKVAKRRRPGVGIQPLKLKKIVSWINTQ